MTDDSFWDINFDNLKKQKKEIAETLAELISELKKQTGTVVDYVARNDMLRAAQDALALIDEKLDVLVARKVTALSDEDKTEIRDAISRLSEIMLVVKALHGEINYDGRFGRMVFSRKRRDFSDWGA